MKALKLASAMAVLALSTSANAAYISVTSSMTPVPIVDAGSLDLLVFTNDPSFGTEGISDVNVHLNFTKCDDPISDTGVCIGTGSSYPSEIVFDLTSPTGTEVSLIAANTYTSNGTGDTYQVTLDDQALFQIGGPLPVDGTFQPIGSLSDFNFESALGLWTLSFADTVGADPMSLNSWGLDITTSVVPVPAAVWLFGSGLIGLAGIARRKA